MVAEPIAHVDDQAFAVGRFDQRLGVGLGVPDRGQIELVGPLRELVYSRDVVRAGRTDVDRQAQILEEVLCVGFVELVRLFG